MSQIRSAVPKSSASNAVIALFISSVTGGVTAGGVGVASGELAGVEPPRDEFHIAIAAIASASTAIAGSR